MSQSFSNNNSSFNTVNVSNSLTVADDRSNILAWLSPLEPRLRHQDIQDRRVGDVGEWLLQTEEFGSWYAGGGGSDSDNAVLFCYGSPGAGKTYISSLVIDCPCDRARGHNIAVACFYLDFAAQKEQSSTGMLGALLKQVVSGLEVVPGEILRAYEDQKKVIGGRALSLSEVVKMLQATTSERRTFICIDALDECVAGYRVKLLDSLNQILKVAPGTQIFVTGRPHIEAEIRKRLSGRVTTVFITPRRDDVVSYLRTRLEEDTTPDAMDSSLEADILKRIPEDISEIFLLVSLNIDAILQETAIRRRRQKLDAMTDGLGLGGAYGATLARVKGQGGEKGRLGMAALMWISHSERPLKADELCHALAVEIGSPNLDADNVPSLGTLLACCQGLVVADKKASTVRLIHFTLQEYLRAHPEIFGAAHSIMAETCLSLLNSEQVKAFSAHPSPDIQDTPFLEYSSLYWGAHAKRGLSDCTKLLAQNLFDNYSNHVSTKILLKAQDPYRYFSDFNKSYRFSDLHCASFFGISELVAGLVEVKGYGINQSDCTGRTPLIWAASRGHEEVVKILLGQDDIRPDKPDNDNRTPLHCAALGGYEGVVNILLGRDDVNPDKPDNHGRTPLSCAAEGGYEAVVNILLGRGDVNPDKPDNHGRTPLSFAASGEYEGVVDILLGQDDVNPDKPDNNDRTPLSWAVETGTEGVVRILLGQDDINPDKPDDEGTTPLGWAACGGSEGMVNILLGRDDVNPDKPDNHGRTPLSYAAQAGFEGVVNILLGRDDVNPDKPDNNDRTPLSWAVETGTEGVVRILLGQDDVNPDKPDDCGRTPLSWAAGEGNEEVVKILLRRDDVSPEKPDDDGQTPLSWAAEEGHEGVVKILMGRDDVNPDKPDNDG